MNTPYYIEGVARIAEGKVALNKEVLFDEMHEDFSAFIKSAYKHFDTKYSKFFKMDSLSKLAFLTADILLKDANLPQDQENNIALVFSNRASSLDTDRKHQESISDTDNYFPSPAVFVYTLPNICLGEISIKHSLYSENSFFIFDTFNAKHLCSYATALLDSNKASSVLCGWVDVDAEAYEAILFLVSKKGEVTFNTNELNRIYNDSWTH